MVQTVADYLDSLARDTGSDPALDLEIADAYRRVAGLEDQERRDRRDDRGRGRDYERGPRFREP